MELIIKLSCIALAGTALISFLRPVAPSFAVMLSILCAVILVYYVLAPLGGAFTSLSGLMVTAGIDGDIYLPVIKAVGIAITVRITSELCRDAGEGALGTKLEFAGAVASIAVCIPLIQQVFELMEFMLQ